MHSYRPLEQLVCAARCANGEKQMQAHIHTQTNTLYLTCRIYEANSKTMSLSTSISSCKKKRKQKGGQRTWESHFLLLAARKINKTHTLPMLGVRVDVSLIISHLSKIVVPFNSFPLPPLLSSPFSNFMTSSCGWSSEIRGKVRGLRGKGLGVEGRGGCSGYWAACRFLNGVFLIVLLLIFQWFQDMWTFLGKRQTNGGQETDETDKEIREGWSILGCIEILSLSAW